MDCKPLGFGFRVGFDVEEKRDDVESGCVDGFTTATPLMIQQRGDAVEETRDVFALCKLGDVHCFDFV